MLHTRLSLLALLGAAAVASSCGEVSRLRARCLSGEVPACTQVGDMYASGRGVDRDLGRAAEMYARACDGGAADVCNTLGEIYEKTAGLEGGMERAAAMFERACTGGSAAGCLNLGLTFAAREDMPRAISLYDRSCAGGWAAGCHQLGLVYRAGRGRHAGRGQGAGLLRPGVRRRLRRKLRERRQHPPGRRARPPGRPRGHAALRPRDQDSRRRVRGRRRPGLQGARPPAKSSGARLAAGSTREVKQVTSQLSTWQLSICTIATWSIAN